MAFPQGHLQEKLRALQRLQRLEQRFSGPGVTEAEARNALRLFERELSKAGWRAGWIDEWMDVCVFCWMLVDDDDDDDEAGFRR